MDKDSVQQIIDVSDKLTVLNTQKLRAKEKFESNTIVGFNGGLFKVNESLLVYVSYLLQNGKQADTVVLDHNQNPILLKSVRDFNNTIQDAYYSALDIYHNDIKELDRLKNSVTRYFDLES
jgi:hypothetical protein